MALQFGSSFFLEYGLKALENGYKPKEYMKPAWQGNLADHVVHQYFSHKPATKKPAETRMEKAKVN